MALLQISEPGESPDPHQSKRAVGIDLGTTHSLIATVRSGVAECLSDHDGRVLLPSAVRYHADRTTSVGQTVLECRSSDPLNCFVSFKRWMGRGYKDINRSLSPYRFLDREGLLTIDSAAGPKTAIDMSAEVLRSLAQRAQESLGGDIDGAVITVPAYFDDAQRQATKDAATLAGIKVLRLLNEPTAAAIAYGLDQGEEGLFLVYDLGGGTFDVSVLRFSRGVFEVLATGGDSALGGDDFDALIVQAWLKDLGLSLDSLSPSDRHRWLILAREAKERLSAFESVTLEGPLGQQLLDRNSFETITKPLLDKTMIVLRRVLRDASVEIEALKGAILVGGATRMPQVHRALTSLLGCPIHCHLDPDEVVAMGAALQANLLLGQRSASDDWLLLDVIPLSLGIETMGGLVEKIIPRNTTIPVSRSQEFTTYKDGQIAMAFHVVQGERELVSDCRSLASFELRGLPPLNAGAARIRVNFQVDADGLLSVSALELSSGVHASTIVKPSYGLGDEAITRMLRDGVDHASLDMQLRALKEQQVEAERMLLAVDAALAADSHLLTVDEQHAIQCAADHLRSLALQSDHHAIRNAIHALSHQTDHFAALRMNRAVSMALSGRKIDELA
ncbi:MAG: Fe-S protein assembly chaperone HscA [Betaproteobacteria bacterium]|jgi:molecular chaperone HscA|nr:Fe-S protein assembly chaperone HscA [Betaproteobacteria bacterium]NCX02591.1 Fe-S protein assembly chaperone HscA [Betaproteobacteria bacterium]NDE31140.1 Fe-S protein assembly chaperone HscA [Betaproteobacteria bacterium]